MGAVDPGQDVLSDPGAHLHRRPGHARQGFGIGRVAVVAEVADHADRGVLRNREIRLHFHPAAAIEGTATAFGEELAQVGWLNSGGPADRGRLQHPFTVLGFHGDPARFYRLHPAPQQQLHSAFAQVVAGGGREAGVHGPQHPIARVDQDHLAVANIQLLEIALEGMAHQLD